MSGAFPSFVIIVAVASLLFPAATEAACNIIDGPTVERATGNSVIISWTAKNPEGTGLHYDVAHYGTSSRNLAEIAKSPNRRNRTHAEITFRVLLQDLKPVKDDKNRAAHDTARYVMWLLRFQSMPGSRCEAALSVVAAG